MLKVKTFYRKNPILDKCPSCGQLDSLRRSHSRTNVEKAVSRLTFYKYYKCKKCGWRGKLKTITFTSLSILGILFYAFLILLVAFITSSIIKKLI